jgi:beta-galactosidase
MKQIIALITLAGLCLCAQAQTRREILLDENWKFSKGDFNDASNSAFDDSRWETVSVPHDWAIYGSFDRKHDLQEVAIVQNGERIPSVKTGRTGGLPYAGVGWYRTKFDVTNFVHDSTQVFLIFDGAMSEARVFVNGNEACFWAYGYNSFYCNVTPWISNNGQHNTLAVRTENKPQSSRWYPGAGLYRNVHLLTTSQIHVPVWGTFVTTPFVSDDYAAVQLKLELDNAAGRNIEIVTEIVDPNNNVVAREKTKQIIRQGQIPVQNLIVEKPVLWSPESPYLYSMVSKIYVDEQMVDEYTTRMGIRDARVIPGKGFFLNGQKRKFQGVCNHHDLGPLGAAVHTAALRRQLTLLKEMGCDAIRTTHNMPAPELVSLCDEMGFMMVIEPFDEWNVEKCENGYHRFFDEWAEKDMINMIRHFRNNPSVVMWSIGNEVPTQCEPDGYQVANRLYNICKQYDHTRPVTCGIDRADCVLSNGFANNLDVPGFNYRLHRYTEAYQQLPQNMILGSETASTVSSRGVYKIPADIKADATYNDHQSSAYDTEYCNWSNLPDQDFAMADDYDWTMGQFVWTGFDYLGEPTPYDNDAWPNHSSMFGIIDLASIPKDRFFLYKSVWNKKENTLHVLPHWNWKGREGQNIPVFVYTNHPTAELFVNGTSYGKQAKNRNSTLGRYRLVWNNVTYQPGELKVVAYDSTGNVAGQVVKHTAGKPHHIQLVTDRKQLASDGKDLAYVTVHVVDENGNLCTNDQRLVTFSVTGNGYFKVTANGDPTCLDPFHVPQMHAFNGQLTAIVQATKNSGKIILEARAKGLKTETIEIDVSQ